ncbi:MAG: large conductance mechanosensitive channel protein MscL [Anaerolineae bacterium]|nr:large conductance mechanosensitive channel protein MscL [Anaerolineae bacterium]
MLNDLKEFAMRGNVVDLAVGFTVGAAFTTIAKSLVDDMIMPVVGLIVGQVEFKELFLLLKAGTEQPSPYATLADAQAAGAVTVNYGIFINNVLAFLIVTVVMFMLIRLLNKLEKELEEEFGAKEEDDAPKQKKCPFCLSTIPAKATRCPQCTSELQPVDQPSSRTNKICRLNPRKISRVCPTKKHCRSTRMV